MGSSLPEAEAQRPERGGVASQDLGWPGEHRQEAIQGRGSMYMYEGKQEGKGISGLESYEYLDCRENML